MIRSLTALLLLLTMSPALLAQTVYRWVDDRGEVHYGHAVPPEHAHRGYDLLRRDGSVRDRVEPALTPEERAQRAARLALEAQTEAERRNQESRDRLLLAAYRSEQDIIDSMELQVQGLNGQRSAIQTSLQRTLDRFATQVGRAAEASREGREVPDTLRSSIEETRDEMNRLRQEMAKIDTVEDELRERYASELDRFRELMGRR
jgi:chromosome segregation ATPase